MKIFNFNKVYYLVILALIVAVVFVLNENDLFNKQQVNKVEIYEDLLDIVYGSPDAGLTVFFYSSYNCSFCREFFKNVFPELKRNFIDNGKLKFVVKPITLTNNEAVINSLKIAVCINKHGNFEKLNELLLTEPNVIYTNEFANVIDELVEEDMYLEECMYGGESENYLFRNLAMFKSLGLTGTPSFIINNKIYKGYMEYDKFKKVIEKELKYILH